MCAGSILESILFAESSGVGRFGSSRSCPQHTTLGQVLSTIRIDSSGPVHNIQRVVRSCPQHAMVRQEGVDLGEHLVRRKHRPRRLSQILQKRKCLLDPVHNMQRFVSSCSKHATLRQVLSIARNTSSHHVQNAQRFVRSCAQHATIR